LENGQEMRIWFSSGKCDSFLSALFFAVLCALGVLGGDSVLFYRAGKSLFS